MLFFLVYCLSLTLPGLFVLRIFDYRGSNPLLFISLSYALIVIFFSIAQIQGLGVRELTTLLVAAYCVIGAWWLWKIRKLAGISNISSRCPHWVAKLWIPVGTMGLVLGYAYWAGPYTEIPSDAWRHIDQLNDAYRGIGEGKINGPPTLKAFLSDDFSSWYWILAYFLHLGGLDVESGLGHLAAANTLLFSAGVYGFSVYIFRNVISSRMALYAAASMSVFFMFTTFGVSVFSYVRYYVYGPAFLNYILYLAVVLCVLEMLSVRDEKYGFFALTLVLASVAAITHRQEVLFMIVMSALVFIVKAVKIITSGEVGSTGVIGAKERSNKAAVCIFSVLALGVMVYVVVHLYAHYNLPQKDPLEHGRLVDIHSYVPFLRNLYILEPTVNFFQVLTFWGVLVYVVFALRWKVFVDQPYFLAGMVSPLVTVFNPLFTDLFLYFAPASLLYRVGYLMPLPFVGAYFFVQGAKKLVSDTDVGRRMISGMLILALIVFLFPVSSKYFVAPYSKVYTLQPVDAGNDYRLWQDLFVVLERLEKTKVVTDSVTGYVVDGFTKHKYPGVKFYVDNWRDWLRVHNESYEREDFEGKNDWLVIINERDGSLSDTGRVGGHWPETIMEVSEQYSDSFIEFVRTQPRMFTRVWEGNGIWVFKVDLSN